VNMVQSPFAGEQMRLLYHVHRLILNRLYVKKVKGV
jgi:hypothetical protein